MRAHGRLWVSCRVIVIDRARCRLRVIVRVTVRVRVRSQEVLCTEHSSAVFSTKG